MARSQARFLVAGPHRDPAELDPVVWESAVGMLKGVFRRLWSGPPSTEAAADPPAVDRLSEVRVPTLVIGSERDRLLPIDSSRRIARDAPNLAELVELPGGHCAILECPVQVNTQLRALAESVALPRASRQ